MLDLTRLEGFDWDEGNSRKNAERHEVGQAEAEQVFSLIRCWWSQTKSMVQPNRGTMPLDAPTVIGASISPSLFVERRH